MKTVENMTFWTPERTELAKELYSGGMSASQVGKAIGATRNAVIGKMHRIGVIGVYKKNSKDKIADKPRQPASKPGAVKVKVSAPRRAPKPPPMPPEPVARPVLTVVPVTAKHWTQRLEGECSWPIAGEGADLIACCRPVSGRWCAEHRKVGAEKKRYDDADQRTESALKRMRWKEENYRNQNFEDVAFDTAFDKPSKILPKRRK